MKKKILIAGLCAALSMPLALIGCGKSNDNMLSATDVYGFGAVSTIKLLGSETAAAALKSFSEVAATDTQTQNNDVKAQIDKFNEYFLALDSFLGKDVVSTRAEDNPDAQFDYQTKLTIRGKDFDGNDTQYVMYYTETEQTQIVDEDEVEKYYALSGVMVIDEVQYNLEGQRVTEEERGERETEIKIVAYQNDRSNRIEMIQEHSVESGETETEYVYSIYANNVLKEQTSVEFEIENKHNKQETGYEIEFISGTERGKYSIEREVKNNVTEIEVEYNLSGQIGRFVIKEIEIEGQKYYQYSFSDGSTKNYIKQ